MMAQEFIVSLRFKILPAIKPKVTGRPWASHEVIDLPPSIRSTRQCLFRFKPGISFREASSGGSPSSGTSGLIALDIIKRNIDP